MAVLSCDETFEGRGGDLTIDDDADTRVFNVTCSLATDNKYTILASGRLPLLNSAHPDNGSRPANRKLFLRRYRIQQHAGAFVWRAQCEYETNVPANTTNSLPEMAREIQPVPLLRRVNCRMVSETYRRPVKRGRLLHSGLLSAWNPEQATVPATAGPITTSAHERFNPAPETDAVRRSWEIEWNVERLPLWFLKYDNAINADALTVRGLSHAKWTLKIGQIQFSDQKEETSPSGLVFPYFTVSFRAQYRHERWLVIEPDMGHLKLSGGKPVRIEDDNKVPVPTPQQLDGAGAVVTSPTAATCRFRIYLDEETPVLPFAGFVPLPAQ
jgi:hypothetical protein